MSRSRSSFDLSSAIATATSLAVATPEEQPAALYRGVPLVSFGPTAAGPPTVMPPDSSSQPASAGPPTSGVGVGEVDPARGEPAEAPTPAVSAEREGPPTGDDAGVEATRRPPKLPDLSEIKNPVLRCQRIIEWLEEAVGVAGVFIADAAGLPVAGDTLEAEARLAATGVVSAAVAHLAASIPGNTSALFEMHVGEGPFFQVIGFEAAGAPFVVGFQRGTPLAFRQAHAVRLACRHALGGDGTDATSALRTNAPGAEHAGRANARGDV